MAKLMILAACVVASVTAVALLPWRPYQAYVEAKRAAADADTACAAEDWTACREALTRVEGSLDAAQPHGGTAPAPRHELAELYGHLVKSYMEAGMLAQSMDAYRHHAALLQTHAADNTRVRLGIRAAAARALHLSGGRRAADADFESFVGQLSARHDEEASLVREYYGDCLVAEGRALLGVQWLEQAQLDRRAATPDQAASLRRLRAALGDAYDRAGDARKARALLESTLAESLDRGVKDSPSQLALRERWGRFLLDHSDLLGSAAQFDAVIRAAGAHVYASAALAHGGLARIALWRDEKVTALRESEMALHLWEHREGFYDMRTLPYLLRIRADSIAVGGQLKEAQELEDEAWETSRVYDAPASPTRGRRKIQWLALYG